MQTGSGGQTTVDPGGDVDLAVGVVVGSDAGRGVDEGGVRRRRSPGLILAVSWICFVLAAAALADLLPLADPTVNVAPGVTAPFHHWPEFLGTDRLGRSVLSRLVYGARVSLVVATVSVVVGLVIGVTLGMIAGTRRSADHAIGLGTDLLLAFPGIVILLALRATMSPGLTPLVIGLILFSLPAFIRLARANTYAVRDREYVQAARLLGASGRRVLVREILPSVIRPVLVYAVIVMAALMVAEASVSFLGLGVVPPRPSWGGMIAAGQEQLRDHRELVLIPAFVLFATVLSVAAIGRSLRVLSATGGDS